MASDMFLQISNCKGDSQDDKHKEWIEIESFTLGVQQDSGGSSSAQGGHTSGKVTMSDFTITKKLDASSPTLYLFCCEAKEIPTATLEVCRSQGSQKTVFYRVKFSDGIVASLSTSGGGGGDSAFPTEELKIRYAKIEWEYVPTDVKGKTSAALKSGWDANKNKKV